MTNKAIFYTSIGLLTGSAIAGVVLVNYTQAQSLNSRQNLPQQIVQVTPRPRGMMTQADRHFIEMMIPHHQGAIDMADLALSRAKRPERLMLLSNLKPMRLTKCDNFISLGIGDRLIKLPKIRVSWVGCRV